MATSTSATRTKSPSRTANSKDAIQLLTADHAEVKKMFKAFEKAEESEKEVLVQQICTALTIHAQLEEEIFYPAARESLEEQDLLDEAEVEHASAKELIAQLETMGPQDALYDAKVTVLGEYIDHHVKEEEGEMFPKVKKAKLDLNELGAQIEARREELQT
jgi:hemerythrin superfamily protein